jgi:hypothetical protein
MKKIIFAPLVIFVFAVFFASHSPDGLDRVSETLGFAGKAAEPSGLMPGYNVEFIGNSKLSAICAGAIGLLIICGLFRLSVFILKRKK